jgi:hypothetical protein
MKGKKREKLLIGAMGLFLILAVMHGTAYAQVPGTINYQGYLADSGGNPIDEPVDMEFEIFDDDTSGTSRWGPETHSSVDVINGIVNVVLGLTNGIEPSELDYNECWLQIKVRYPEGSWETLTPRQRVTGAPYAVLAQDADKLDGLNSTAFIQTETDHRLRLIRRSRMLQ